MGLARRAYQVRRHVAILIGFLLVAGVYLSGLLSPIEYAQGDLRFRLTPRAPDPAIVIVAIDSHSLQELALWPWPRSWHAQMIDNLAAAGAARVAFTIDFSARSDDAEDAALAEALAAIGRRAILPIFQQPATSDRGQYVFSAPLPELMAEALVGSVNLRLAPDGLVRQADRRSTWGQQVVPTLPLLLADQVDSASDEPFFIDFGIEPASATIISYVDVLTGKFEPDLVSGKTVLVGATARELGGNIPVPYLGVIPGVMVEAMAAQSLLLGRDLAKVPVGVVLAAAALILLGAGWLMRRLTLPVGLILTVVLCLLAFGAATLLQFAQPLMLDVVPLQLAAIVAFLSTLFGRIQSLDILVSSQASNLRRKEIQLRRFAENTFDGVMIFDGEYRLASLNPAAERMFSWREAEVVGAAPGQFFNLAGGGAGPTLDALAAAGRHQEMEGLRRDGPSFAADVAVSSLSGDGFVVLVHDLSAQRTAEQMAETLGRRLHDAIESISEGFALFDRAGRLVLCNTRMKELYSPGASFVPGDTFERIMQGYYGATLDETAAAERLRRRLADFRTANAEFVECLPSGRWLRGNEHRLADGGTVTVLTDISALKKNELELTQARDQAQEANRSKSRFLANMSHELRTPLNAILGFSEVLKLELLGSIGSPQYRQYAQDIFKSGSHLLSIINDILDLSQIEAGKMVLRETEFAPVEAVSAAMNLIGERAARDNVTLRTQVGQVPHLYADQRIVIQILVNLLSNAVKFTPAGGVVEVGVRQDGESGRLVFMVSDTGIGISQEDIARIMQPFEQGETDWARYCEGSGLGLPIVSAMIGLHGGLFGLFSEPGKGTVASVEFPAWRCRSAPGEGRSTPDVARAGVEA